MSKFKAGDKVRFIGVSNEYVGKGAEGTVERNHFASDPTLLVRWVSGPFNTTDNGCWWTDPEEVELIKAYSSNFTKIQPKVHVQGHVPGSGIQRHSVGDIYPLAVVAYDNAGRILYTLENLETGRVASLFETDGEVKPISFTNAAAAFEFAAHYLTSRFAWQVGRPIHSPELGVLVFKV